MILVADIGGTHTRFALAAWQRGQWQLQQLQVVPTVTDIGPVIQQYLANAGRPALAGFACCGAGPVDAGGRISLTNTDTILDPKHLARAAGLPAAVLVNDFAAVAHAIPGLSPAMLRPLDDAVIQPAAPRVVIGAGTGLGVACLVPVAGGWHVIPGEGGHADLAPVYAEQASMWQRLQAAHGRVSAETVLSGPGLERLHAVLVPGSQRAAADIAAAAWRSEPEALKVVRLFTQWLGSFAGNLALTLGAQGGVYLAGGIVPAWAGHFDQQVFRQAFEDKRPFTDWLRRIPSFVVTHPQPGLYGLAVLAGSALQTGA